MGRVHIMNLFIGPHNDDLELFCSYSILREKNKLAIVVTDSFIQPNRGEIGCSAEERREETINAMAILKCPVVFLGIKDTELTERIFRERIRPFVGMFEKIYAPYVQEGNSQHDIIGSICREVFPSISRYTTYTKTELWTKGDIEVVPTEEEKYLKTQALNCYKSQILLPSTRPHFEAVVNRSEWLV